MWVFDYDAHHGNGTQAVFVDDPRVLFVSLHQWPLYPGTGRVTETGTGAGRGTTMNIPLPPGATGDVYLRAFDEVVAPVVERFAPTWLLISAGFDAHRDDPLTELGLTAGDFALLTARALAFVPPGRCVAMLEGGYDLDALSASAAAVLGTLAGAPVAAGARRAAGGPGAEAVADARSVWSRLDALIAIVRRCGSPRSLPRRHGPRTLRPGPRRAGPAGRALRRGRSPAVPRRRRRARPPRRQSTGSSSTST